jgi:membrane protein DedA with SNARE-associated domain
MDPIYVYLLQLFLAALIGVVIGYAIGRRKK